ncbi:MAG: hypothetical protein NZM43_11720 [Saprospiraceae bacterium]|nr:hypothetical protein [Saprospiraceae bacterium]MDW8484977.1 hypothetical protein [Saprospiraceae bacterium]
MNTCAVLDLGTNIFHLLIAQADASAPLGWTALRRDRVPVHLAEEGIERIGEAAFQRGLEALRRFRQQTIENGIALSDIRAFGTAALRTARNAPDFLRAIEQETGICPEVISGQREAELIFKGVRQAVPLLEDIALIVDIGGGSVEFILTQTGRVHWQQSFPIGTTVLYHRFHKSDPIAPEEIAALEAFLQDTLGELWNALMTAPTHAIVGAAGAFDTLNEMLHPSGVSSAFYSCITRESFDQLYTRIVPSTLAERSTWPELKPERRQTIVVGMVLIRHLLERTQASRIYTSKFSLKEGAVAEWLERRGVLPAAR